METAAIYALGRLLGHQCLSTSVIVANRVTGEFGADITSAMDRLISEVLDLTR
jgi:uridine phosphorylase